jgi:hypothetical protein
MRTDKRRRVPTVCSGVHSARGSVTIVFMVMVLPLLFALLTITVDLSNYFGIRDELQRVIDREAHDALVYGKTAEQVNQTIRTRMGILRGMASITSVRSRRSRGQHEIFVDGTYQGGFAEVARHLYGQTSSVLSFAARAQVRIQPSAALIIFDRSIDTTSNECTDGGLQAMSLFVDRLAESWAETAGTMVSVGVFPGETSPIELLRSDASDGVSRCRAALASAYIDAAAVRGTADSGGFSVTSFAYRAQELAARNLVAQPVQVRSIIFVMRRVAYDAAYSTMAYAVIKSLVAQTFHPVDFFVFVLDDTGQIDSRPFTAGINGGAFREVTASRADFENVRLLSAATQTITDRIVLER